MTHLDAIDATFLELEEADETAHMHIGGVLEFEPAAEGSVPTIEAVREQLDARIDLLPRYRQRLSHQHTGGLEWPSWEPDEAFHISRHVRHATLPAPGGEAELTEWAADFWSHRMDRAAPLWEVALVDGLASGGWAMVTKTHHCMVDGVGSIDLAHLLLDADQSGSAATPWQAPAEEDAGRGLPGWLSGPAHLSAAGVRGGARAVRHPRETLHRSRLVAGLLVRSELHGSPSCSLNVPITGHRRFAAVDTQLEEIRRVAHAHDAKINDVVMALVAGALRRLLLARGEQPPKQGLRAMVPVNVRSVAEHDGRLGNRISSLFVDLPVAESDQIARIHRAREASMQHKQGEQALGTATLLGLTSLAPPVVHSSIARTLYATRLFNLTVTNVPGPRVSLYAFGARLRRILPLVPLAAEHSIGVAIISYDDTLTFGLVGDFDAAADLAVFRGALADEVEQLVGTTAR